MIEKEIKYKILEEILLSPEFSNAQRYKDLLQYIVKASISGKEIKETTIAIDVFSKDASFEPTTDPTVRVYMSNLRKKLEHYYLSTGKDQVIRIDIPKGHYHAEYVNISQSLPENAKKNKIIISALAGIIILSFIVIAYLITRKGDDRQTVKQNYIFNNPVWSGFNQNNLPNLIVLGDYFFMYERKDNLDHFIRDPKINSNTEYKDFLARSPEYFNKYLISNITYLRPSVFWAMMKILPAIQTSKEVHLKLASELIWDDLQQNNIIFVGTFKNLFILRELLEKSKFKYQISPPKLFVKSNSDSTLTYSIDLFQPGIYTKDYVLILNSIGPNNNNLLLLISFGETGMVEAARLLTESKEKFEVETNLKFDSLESINNYNMILEVEGIDRNTFRSKMVSFLNRDGK